jgi:hypothetical protein
MYPNKKLPLYDPFEDGRVTPRLNTLATVEKEFRFTLSFLPIKLESLLPLKLEDSPVLKNVFTEEGSQFAYPNSTKKCFALSSAGSIEDFGLSFSTFISCENN